jgi:hypothetical protein
MTWWPWQAVGEWGRAWQVYAVENARVAAVACSAAQAERIEIELYVAQLAGERARQALRRDRPAITA